MTDIVNTPVAFDWNTAGMDADTLGYVQSKGFKAPGDAVVAYREFEKLQGMPADRIVRMPAPDAKPEEIAAYRQRLGAGKLATDYKFEVPQGADPKFAETAASWFHEEGLPVSASQNLVKKWNAHMGEVVKQQDTEYQAKVETEKASLKTEWGKDHDVFMANAKKAAGVFGVKEEQMNALEKSVGYSGVMKLFANIASKMGESSFAGDGGTTPLGGMTPEQARNELGILRQDAAFIKKYSEGDADAKAKFDKLHIIAYPS